MAKKRNDTPSLEQIASLYAVAPPDFIEARNALVAELKEKGATAAAAEIKALRRPALSLWAVNQLGRRHEAVVDELIEAGAALHEAQRGALEGGDAEGFREAMRRYQDAVAVATSKAAELLESNGHGATAHLLKIQSTLHAAGTGDYAEQLRAGALTTELGPQGFGDAPTLRLVSSGGRSVKKAAAAKKATAKDGAPAAAKKEPPKLELQKKRDEETPAQRAAKLQKLKVLERKFEFARKQAVSKGRLAEIAEAKAAQLRGEATQHEREMFELKRELEASRRGLTDT